MPLTRPQSTEPGHLLQALMFTIDRVESYEPWHEVGATNEPAFANSWVNFGGAPATETAAFYKDASNRVHLKGSIKNGSAVNTTAFTLPTGYRPAAQLHFAANSNNAYGSLLVNADGTVVPFNGSTAHFSLSGASWRVA